MVTIAKLITRIVREGEVAVPQVKQDVLDLCARFPLYEDCVIE